MSGDSKQGQNRLAAETSPYLLQHRDNPVQWWAWGEEAFAAARAEQKPILLSVGYAACHWCHVMAHESFESHEIAEIMNQNFINIKVDREERPDIDLVYQNALALLGEQGGWPLTMFLTPEGEPFWGGTYFPPEQRWGRPGFPDVLRGLSQAYQEGVDAVRQNKEALAKAMAALSTSRQGSEVTPQAFDAAQAQLLRQADPIYGGIGAAPKFPQPSLLKFLWRRWISTGNVACRQVVEHSLKQMCQGGIYDHLGGGFARYSVDEKWLVPHFEKMLYDNAQLLDLLSWAYAASQEALFRQRAEETVAWLMQEMRAAGDEQESHFVPAFAASLDADSEGEEGRFYVWSAEELQSLLSEQEVKLFCHVYDVFEGGNWEGKTILNRSGSLSLLDPDKEALLAQARSKLLDARARRVRPGWDDKVLTDWNAMTIAALARASQIFAREDWLEAASKAQAFILDNLRSDGRLYHSWRRGKLRHRALLEDYAFLAESALALYEAKLPDQEAALPHLNEAQALVTEMNDLFWDDALGGYYQTARDSADLILRPKSITDNATPPGNAAALDVLARLYHLTGNSDYAERALATEKAFSGDSERLPHAMTAYLSAVETLHHALQITIVSSKPEDAKPAVDIVRSFCLPAAILQVVQAGSSLPSSHPAFGKSEAATDDGTARVYICEGQHCSLPIGDLSALKSALWKLRAPS